MKKAAALVTVATATILLTTGCVANNPSAGADGALTVTSTQTGCDVSANEATSGLLSFEVTNAGTEVTEFYLMAEDGLRIIGEVENIAPGASRTLTTTVQPGSYLTLCKPGMLGSGVGSAAFTVAGERVQLSGDDAEQMQHAVDLYAGFVRDQVGRLLPAVQDLAEQYANGQDEAARAAFPTTRAYYERIEPVAEALGDLDPRIDYREIDAAAEGLDWTGFHRMEKDLWQPEPGDLNSDGETDAYDGWQPSTPEQRRQIADQLVADVTELHDFVTSDEFTDYLSDQGIDWISNGAIALLDEVAQGKITGEEDWWSGTDLWDFAANVEGSRMAFSLVRDLAEATGSGGVALVADISAGYDGLEAELATFGSLEQGFVSYEQLTDADKRRLTNEINALAEPLSQLTATVLS